MHLSHRQAPLDHPQALLPRLRQGVGEVAGPPQRLGDPITQLPGGEPGLVRLRVDGDDPPRAVPHEVDNRVGHLATTPVHEGSPW